MQRSLPFFQRQHSADLSGSHRLPALGPRGRCGSHCFRPGGGVGARTQPPGLAGACQNMLFSLTTVTGSGKSTSFKSVPCEPAARPAADWERRSFLASANPAERAPTAAGGRGCLAASGELAPQWSHQSTAEPRGGSDTLLTRLLSAWKQPYPGTVGVLVLINAFSAQANLDDICHLQQNLEPILWDPRLRSSSL